MRKGELIYNILFPTAAIVGITAALIATAPPLARNILLALIAGISIMLIRRRFKTKKNRNTQAK